MAPEDERGYSCRRPLCEADFRLGRAIRGGFLAFCGRCAESLPARPASESPPLPREAEIVAPVLREAIAILGQHRLLFEIRNFRSGYQHRLRLATASGEPVRGIQVWN